MGVRLSDFIRSNLDGIIAEWENFARSLNPGSSMTTLQLKDHIEQILSFIARDLEAPQSASEQFDKSRGLADSLPAADTAAETHGILRHDDGYDIMEMVSEYRALRASIIKLWTEKNKNLSDEDVIDLTRFNESIDQALAESVVKFAQKVDQSKDLILGVLGHDIRSPLATIHMSAEILKRTSNPDERHMTLLTQIESSTARVRSIVTDLLDLAKARLGTGIPLIRAPMSLSDLCVSIVEEMRVQHPDRPIVLQVEDDVRGDWDATRLGQVLSNLLSNAMQYGLAGSTVKFTLAQSAKTVLVSVHNNGDAIPPTHLESIFESFTRAPGRGDPLTGESQNLGLGLFISREIVNAHGGSINATSTQADGTTFSIRLPKTKVSSGFPLNAQRFSIGE
ncbi:sensor histidine kinase [Asticcacaulis benevestitus]|uniref:sensor histidine kinase n=1 Tax=Asticcacaulis benevestitus TaxID=347481 RepID=UPI001F1B5B99|nr:HAMP domain-containing sensor histidine kinase [Asticcacaulis benevestitus]